MQVARGKWTAFILGGFCLGSTLATAKLGGKIDSIAVDREAYGATTHHTTQSTGYSVHESSSAGLTIRQYADTAGNVFAVAWQGVNQPDLTALLGDFNAEYLTAFQQAPRARGRSRHSRIESSNIVVEKHGHMRAMSGRAYVPALVPGGVQLSQIQ